MYPRFPRLLQYAYLKMADGHVALWSICHYAFRWWTNVAWALETVETKSMKGTISHFSTWHDGILEQYIRCGFIRAQSHLISFILSAYWKRSCNNMIQLCWLLWIHPIKNLCSWHTQNGWIWKPFHDVFRFQHCIVMTNVDWTQQVWIGNQCINAEARKFVFSLTLSWSCSKYVVLVVFNSNWQALMHNPPFFFNMSVMPTEHLLCIIAIRK